MGRSVSSTRTSRKFLGKGLVPKKLDEASPSEAFRKSLEKPKAPGKTAEELFLQEQQQKELSAQRKRMNQQIKGALRGRIGAKSLLSGGYTGITDELAAGAALSGTRAGRTATAQGLGGGGGGGGGGGYRGGGDYRGGRGTLIP